MQFFFSFGRSVQLSLIFFFFCGSLLRVPEGGGDCSSHGSVHHALQSDCAGGENAPISRKSPKVYISRPEKMDTERMAYSENSPDVKRIYNLRRKNMNALYLIHRRQSYSWGGGKKSCCCKPQISTNPSKSCTRLDWLRLKSPATAPRATQPSLSRAPPIRALFKPVPIGSHEGVLHL